MLPTQTSSYDKFSHLVTYKSFKNRKNKTMSEAFADVNQAFDVLLYMVSAQLGIVHLSKWLNKKIGVKNGI